MTTLTEAPPRAPVTDRGGALTGTWTLVRFMLRRDRIRIPLWIGGITLMTVGTANNFTQTYPTAAARQTIAQTMDSPAGIAMVGVNHSPDNYTFGAMMGQQMLWSTVVAVALMTVLLLVRHTRTEEASGRAELVRAGVAGRHSAMAAGLVVVAIANVVLGVVMAAGLGAAGIETITWSGSWLYGAAHVTVGLVFAGVAAVTVQVTEHPRGASGMAIAVLGGAYVVRGIGDVGDGTLSWLSPIGWAQATQVYVNDRWWPLLIAIAATVVLVASAVVLSTRRDVGAGLRPPRLGTPTASAALANPFGLALRLHRGSLIAWSAGLFLLGTSYGSVLGDAETWLADIEALSDMLPDVAGVTLTETFAAMVTTVMAIFASVYTVLATQKLRSEETAGRAEPVLATAVSKARWVTSHLAVAMLGGAVVLLAGGLGLGISAAASTGDSSLLPRLLGAALAYVPALWVTTAVAAALFGVASRALQLAWVVVVYSFIVVYLGGLLGLADWMTNLSPFGHVPQLPAAEFTATPLIVLSAVAAGLVMAGLAAFRRRDLQSPT